MECSYKWDVLCRELTRNDMQTDDISLYATDITGAFSRVKFYFVTEDCAFWRRRSIVTKWNCLQMARTCQAEI